MKISFSILGLGLITAFLSASMIVPSFAKEASVAKKDEDSKIESTLSPKAQEQLKKKRETYKAASPAIKSELRAAGIKKKELRETLSTDAKSALKAMRKSDLVEAKNPKVKTEIEEYQAKAKKIDEAMSKEAQEVRKSSELSDDVKQELRKKRLEARQAKKLAAAKSKQ